jgi:hypothetical protein
VTRRLTADDVDWWRWEDDGACHAFVRRRDQPQHVRETVCGRQVWAWRIDRNGTGYRCLGCRQRIHQD